MGAGQQLQDLILEVAGKLEGVDRLLEKIEADGRQKAQELAGIRERLAALESLVAANEKWSGEERRKTDGRLESGDHTFGAIREEIRNVDRIAKWCREQIQKKETTKRPFWVEKLIEALIPMGVGFVWWLLYHMFLVGPKIAEAMKTVNPSGGHHP